VFDTLAASLAGSTRGLKQFGIVLSTADIQQRAFKLGLIDTVDSALTPAAKAQAIYSLEMDNFAEVSKRAQKNQDDLANVSQRLGAEFDNLKEKIGTALLPFVEKVAIVIEQRVIPFISEWADRITGVLVPALETAGGFLERHADDILKVAQAFITASGAAIALGSALEAIQLGAELLTSPIGIVLALATAVIYAYQNVKIFHDVVDAAIGGIISALGPLPGAVADAFGSLNDAFDAASRHEKFSVQLRIVWAGVQQVAGDLWDALVLALEGETRRAEPIMVRGKNIQFDRSTRVEGLIERIQDAIQGVNWTEVGHRIGEGIRDGIIASITTAGPAIAGAIKDAVSGITLGDVFDWTVAFMDTIDAVKGFFLVDLPLAIFDALGSSTFSWSDLWNSTIGAIDFGALNESIDSGMTDLRIRFENKLQEVLGGAASAVMGFLGGLPGLVIGLFSRLVSGAIDALASLRPGTQGIIGAVVSTIIELLAGLVPRAVGLLGNLVSSGLSILRGMIGGAASAAGSVVNAIVNAFASVVGRVVAALGRLPGAVAGAINRAATSAFTAAVGIGASIVQGIISGIGGLAGMLYSAVRDLAGNALQSGLDFIKGHSPSELFAKEMGEPIAQGIALGITRASGLVDSAVIAAIAPPVAPSAATSAVAGTVNTKTVNIGQVVLPSVRSGEDMIRQLDALVAQPG